MNIAYEQSKFSENKNFIKMTEILSGGSIYVMMGSVIVEPHAK